MKAMILLTLFQMLIAVTATVSAAKQEYEPFATFVMCMAWWGVGWGCGLWFANRRKTQ